MIRALRAMDVPECVTRSVSHDDPRMSNPTPLRRRAGCVKRGFQSSIWGALSIAAVLHALA